MVEVKSNSIPFSGEIEGDVTIDGLLTIEKDADNNDPSIIVRNVNTGTSATAEVRLYNNLGPVGALFCTSSFYNLVAGVDDALGFFTALTKKMVLAALAADLTFKEGALTDMMTIKTTGIDFEGSKVSNIGHLVNPVAVPASPVAGSMYFDPATDKLHEYDGAAWKEIQLV